MSATVHFESWGRLLETPGALRNSADRAQIGATMAALARSGPHELGLLAAHVIEAAAQFRAALARDQVGVLDLGLTWTDDEQAFAHWAAHACDRVSAVVASAAESPCARVKDQPAIKSVAAELVAATLAMTGDAIKWSAIAAINRPTALIARANRALRLAEWAQVHDEDVVIEVDGDKLSRKAPHLYLRALLLDFLASGNLSRQQIEVADAWLFRWSRDYAIARATPPGVPSLWVDASRADGLRMGNTRDGADVRHVLLSALPEHLESVTRAFHAGRIFPAFGISTTFRLEEHIAVIDHWQRLLGPMSSGTPVRSDERVASEEVPVEAFVGVHEVFERGFAPSFNLNPDVARRMLSLRDASAGGLGLALARGEQPDVNVGDFIAVREKDDTLAVGEVARRAPAAHGGSVLGVLVHSRDARPVALKRIAGEDGRGAMQVEAVYVPGTDTCGRADSLVVNDTAYAPRARYSMVLGEEEFEVSLNRVRRKGRGWMSCGIEVLARKASRPEALAA